ncbi:MAG: UDP-N-acetylmuramoyl-L-alanyl-D-glutamate--2,6-diaminopimelate ligase [Myxococcota bacterium]
MRLSELLSSLPPGIVCETPALASTQDPVIRGIAYDSRRIAAGDLFFALRGSEADGHEFISKAIELGAAAMIVESVPDGFDSSCPMIAVRDSRRSLAPISTRFFGNPSSELELIGITGTNGKTSSSYLVESILQHSGVRTGMIGTVDVRFAGERERAVNTTPESYELQRTLRAMRTHDIEAVVMEVSSHGLELGRVEGCTFAVAAITNVTQDHLDFHETMLSYRHAKRLLFEQYLEPRGTAVVNVDDPNSSEFEQAAVQRGARLIRVSRDRNRDAEVCLDSAEIRLDGTSARLHLPGGELELNIPIMGDFNLENALVACGIGVALDIAPDAIAGGVAHCPQVPGRVERVTSSGANEPTVIVDYAHTPDAIEKLLSTLRPLADGRLISVFGCGGDRDRGKRSMMAEAVARHSDRIIATSDNPRTEDPIQILVDVETGLTKLRRVEADALESSDGCYSVIPDRRSAIEAAIAIARPSDIVVLAGKGHEDYQIIGRDRLPFDDRDEARRALDARSGN